MDYEVYILQALDDMALCINVGTRYLDELKNTQLDNNQEMTLVNKLEIYKRMETCASMLINFKSKVDECKDKTLENNGTKNNSETGRTEHTPSGDQEQTTN